MSQTAAFFVENQKKAEMDRIRINNNTLKPSMDIKKGFPIGLKKNPLRL